MSHSLLKGADGLFYIVSNHGALPVETPAVKRKIDPGMADADLHFIEQTHAFEGNGTEFSAGGHAFRLTPLSSVSY